MCLLGPLTRWGVCVPEHILGIKEGTEQERQDERVARISRLHPPEKYMPLPDLELYKLIKDVSGDVPDL